jgi:hypothetical protein
MTQKKKYKYGGFTVTEGLTNGTEAAAGASNALVDIFGQPNEFGRQSGVATGLKQAGSLASAGAAFGGLPGAVAGGVLGLGAGLIGSIGAKKKEEALKHQNALDSMRFSETAGLNFVQSNADQFDGSKNAQNFKFGGQIDELGGGSMEIKGPSHENGGVALPNGAEVEGGETISKGYVFSKELGFADDHKPLAKAIGKLEGKRTTEVRKNTLHALQAREQKLALQQETVKHILGV